MPFGMSTPLMTTSLLATRSVLEEKHGMNNTQECVSCLSQYRISNSICLDSECLLKESFGLEIWYQINKQTIATNRIERLG